MDKNILYIGVELDKESQELLRKKYGEHPGWKIFCHHMTSVFNDGKTELTKFEEKWFKRNMGKQVILVVTHYGENEKAAAVRVMGSVLCRNKYRHITLGTNIKNGGKPFNSNQILKWTLTEPVILVGKIKTWYKKKK